MLRTNEDKLIEMLLQCSPGLPPADRSISVDHQGKPFDLPGIGGITLNLSVGDSAFGWEGDHLEPGVSCRSGLKAYENPNAGLQFYSSTGNKATIISGKAKGKTGTVIGHHGGSEHVIIDFDRKTKEKMTYDDKIIIKSHGVGLKLLDYPSIITTSLSPQLLKKMKIKENKTKKKLEIPVTTIIPAECMGSGIGHTRPMTGDYDVMTSDESYNKKHNLNKMRFGDFVAIMNHDNRYGRTLKKGAVTIGIVIHSDCKYAGHGPGITTLLTCGSSDIIPVINKNANIADYMQIGTKAKKK